MSAKCWYNVYQGNCWVGFPTREEADLFAEFQQVDGPVTRFIKRYGCYSEKRFLELKKEREQILELYNKLAQTQTDKKILVPVWTAYSRFWWEHRDKIKTCP